jgi:hypothetical protein
MEGLDLIPYTTARTVQESQKAAHLALLNEIREKKGNKMGGQKNTGLARRA